MCTRVLGCSSIVHSPEDRGGMASLLDPSGHGRLFSASDRNIISLWDGGVFWTLLLPPTILLYCDCFPLKILERGGE